MHSFILGRDIRTIEQWLKNIGKKSVRGKSFFQKTFSSNRFHLFICGFLKLNLQFIQMDELWSFLKNKNHQLWVFIAFDVPSKFWINFELGSRTNHTASRLVSQVKSLGNWTYGQVLKITTDKLAAYKNALSKHFVDIPYHYLQIVKKRYKRRLITVKKCFVKGTEFEDKVF